MMRRSMMALSLILIGAPTPAADVVAPDALALARLDGFAQGLTAADAFSGVVFVGRDGHVIFERAYGTADEKSDRAATIDTRYNLASAGKMFTTVAIFQQIAAGRLTLDTKVGAVLADYRNRDFADHVSIRQLLTHTAGAGDIDLFGVENAATRARVHSVRDLVALYEDRPPEFVPGTKQEYSNYGFVLLGRIVEMLSGQDYETYVRSHIFEPAGMAHTGFVDCTTDAPDIAVGYASVAGKRVRNCATQPARGIPAGGELSTAGDMYRFVRALKDGKLIPRALLAQAITPYRQFMGLGFFATDYGPGHATSDFRWGHAGSTDGACIDVRTYPVTGETVIVLTNRDAPACFPVAGFLHQQVPRKTSD